MARPVSALTVNSVVTNGLAEPFSVAADTNDFYFITDTANHRILKYSPLSGVLTNLAGLIRNPRTSDGANYFARFNAPKGIIRAGNFLVVADTGNHLIRKVTPEGVVTRLAGSARGYSDGPAATARFNTPIGLAADAAGNLFIADTKNNAIRRLDILGNVGTVSAGFSEPVGVAVSDDGRRIFVADTLAHSIKRITTDWTTFTNVTRIAGSAEGISGANDSIFGVETLFNSPRGLLWVDDQIGLLVCDTGNQGIRRVFSNPDFNGIPGAEFSVETYAGLLSQPGFVNGPADVAKFNAPVWLARDSGGYLVADVTNNALRRIQVAEPQPAVSAPDIGWVDYPKDTFGERVTALQPVSWGRFYNDVTIAVRVTDPIGAVSTLFTVGPTFINRINSAGVMEQVSNVENIPPPEEGSPVPEYKDGWPESRQITSLIPPQPDVTVKVRSIAGGRTPSPIKVARFQFLVATPQIVGDNPNSFVVLNQTIGATMYYTTDGSEPSPTNPKATELVDPTNVSILIGTSPVLFTVKGFKNGFQDSET